MNRKSVVKTNLKKKIMDNKEKVIVDVVSKKLMEMVEDAWNLIKDDPNIPQDTKNEILKEKQKAEKQIRKIILG
jgi:regulator of RNase E activity RraB